MKMEEVELAHKYTLSVVMSIYKSESSEYLKQALNSIWFEQYYKPAEIVIVKDGPLTNELDDLILSYKDKMGDVLIIVSLSENVGLGAALNEGLSFCTSEFVARMDTDDISYPDRFTKQISYFNAHRDVDIIGSFATEIDEVGVSGILRKMPIRHDQIYDLLWASPIIHPSVMFRLDKIIALGGYKKELRRKQDYELWFRCAYNGLRFYNIPEPLLYYRFDRTSHRKQNSRLAWNQALIGYHGAKKLKMKLWIRVVCFLPFIRSLFPARLQHTIHLVLGLIDPRKI